MAALVQRIRARAASLPTFDIPFLLILLLLLSYGLIMLFSAGYAVALYRRGDAYTYIRPQLAPSGFYPSRCCHTEKTGYNFGRGFPQ